MRIITLCYILCLLPLTAFSSNKTFIINLPTALENSPSSEAIQTFYIQVYQELGITPIFSFTPAQRSFRYLKEGKIQAEAYRNGAVGKAYNLTTQLMPPLTQVKVALFCVGRKNCEINSKLRYVVPSSFEYAKHICKRLGITCEGIKSSFILNKMLENGTVHAALYPYPSYKSALCDSKAKQLYFKELPEHFFNIYHYVNIDDLALRQKISANLAKHIEKKTFDFSVFNGKPDLSECGKYLNNLH